MLHLLNLILVKADGTATDCLSTDSFCPANAACTTSICNCNNGFTEDAGLCGRIITESCFVESVVSCLNPRLHLRTNQMRQSKTNEFFFMARLTNQELCCPHEKKRLDTFLLSQHPAFKLPILGCSATRSLLPIMYGACTSCSEKHWRQT